MRFLQFAGAALGACAVLLHAADAPACGGCFHQPTTTPDKPVVTDHRMVFSISTTQSVLWDQIRYSGNPADFAWVLPVKPGAVVEASNEGWFAALDAATQPVVYAPRTGGASTAGGCAGLGCASAGGAGGDNAGSNPGVQVVREGTAGIYDTVTLRSTDPNALVTWLDSNGYAIPDSIRPTIDAYVAGGFDFIALRMRPDCEVRAMQPVRVVTPGADPSLPLRMVAAGVGANVGITLFVIGEGRYHPQNFPDANVDFTGLTYDYNTQSSNYESLIQQAMSGSGWVTEAAFNLSEGPSPAGGLPVANPSLDSACTGGSSGGGSRPPPCGQSQSLVIDGGIDDALPTLDGHATEAGNDAANGDDAGEDAAQDAAGDAAGDGAGDAGDDAADDANQDAGGQDAGSDASDASANWICGDDLQLATTGLHSGDVWVTRLRAFLPVDALSKGDLVLEAAPSQSGVTNVHQAASFDGAQPSACESSPRLGESAGAWAIVVVAGLGVAAITRRRRER
jgi:hypothetical protein